MYRSTAESPLRRHSQLPRYFRWFSTHCVLRQIDESDVARIGAELQLAMQVGGIGGPTQRAAAVDAFVRSAQTDWMSGQRYTMAVLRKQSHDFVGWIELHSTAHERGTWFIETFVHPRFEHGPLAAEIVAAAADLMFSALGAAKLYANCALGDEAFEQILNGAGFIELIPAGSLDGRTGKPRPSSLFELGHGDWRAISREREATAAAGTALAREGTSKPRALALI